MALPTADMRLTFWESTRINTREGEGNFGFLARVSEF
jgi:hypothetical protein